MAFVDVGVGAAAMFGVEGLSTAAAGAIGSGLVGAGVGGVLAGVQGKNVLNGALMGGALGAVGGGIGGAISDVNAADGVAQSLGYADTQAALDAGVNPAVLNSQNPATLSQLASSNAANTSSGVDTGVNSGTSPGTSNAATNAAKSAMTSPSAMQYLKYGLPIAMTAYGLLGPKSKGITSVTPVAGAQSTPSPNMINAGLASNYRAAPALAAAEGGIMKLATGGTAPSMTPAVIQSTYNPADVNTAQSSTLSPSTESLLSQYGISSSQAQQGLSALQNAGVLGSTTTQTAAEGGIMGLAAGGNAGYNLGGYSDGGRLLKGPGDGMSDEIPATIAHKQPARLAEGEFVVPADVVSHLGNGSTDAGAKHLYKMMDNVRQARTGNKKQGKQIKAEKFLPK